MEREKDGFDKKYFNILCKGGGMRIDSSNIVKYSARPSIYLEEYYNMRSDISV